MVLTKTQAIHPADVFDTQRNSPTLRRTSAVLRPLLHCAADLCRRPATWLAWKLPSCPVAPEPGRARVATGSEVEVAGGIGVEAVGRVDVVPRDRKFTAKLDVAQTRNADRAPPGLLGGRQKKYWQKTTILLIMKRKSISSEEKRQQ